MLEAHEQDLQASRARDPDVAIVEAVWAPYAQQKGNQYRAITDRVNALLRERGESWLQLEGNRLETRELGTYNRHNGKRKACAVLSRHPSPRSTGWTRNSGYSFRKGGL